MEAKFIKSHRAESYAFLAGWYGIFLACSLMRTALARGSFFAVLLFSTESARGHTGHMTSLLYEDILKETL